MQNAQLSDGLLANHSTGNDVRLDDPTTKVSGACPRTSDPQISELNGIAARQRNRRRSTRRDFEAVVRVYGRALNGNEFYEDARTINVSVHGALLQLSVPVSKGQKLLLFNEATERQQVCEIVAIRGRDAESHEVAVAFPTPHAEFWHIPQPAKNAA